MKKHRISYRDWLNRGPQAPAGESLASRDPAASGITEYTEEQQATEHTEEPQTAEVAITTADVETAETAITTAGVETATTETSAGVETAEPATATTTAGVETAELTTTTTTAETASAPDASVEHLVFRVGRELFALPLDDVEEAIDVDQVQRIPEMGATMLGVITLRGASVPLYAPAVPLGVTGERTKAALIFVTTRGRVALAVDDVDDVLVISPDDIRRAPLDFGDEVLVGVTRRGRDLIGVLTASALIAACRAEPALETV